MKLVRKIALLFSTVRHLRLRQVAFQFWYRLRPTLKIVPSTAAKVNSTNLWHGNLYSPQSYFGNNTFQFLNHHVTVNDWNDSHQSKIWLYNLHYFDDLNAIDSDNRVDSQLQLIHQWILENPPMHGNGWEPYPLSLRIVNWIKWLKRFPNCASSDVVDSLHTQVRALEQQLEFHILANHLFANTKALVFAGYFFSGRQAESWKSRGEEILYKELEEQFLDDGAHFERSPMYHCIMLWDVLDLYSLLSSHKSPNKELLAKLLAVSERALGWLKQVCHPDHRIPFFNDTTFGIAPEPREIYDYAQALGLTAEIHSFSSSGFAKLEGHGFHLVADVGEIAPTYQPGHAHAEAGSFELSIDGKRLIVNAGINQYGVNKERLQQRKTSAHSTVSVVCSGQECDSSEVWSGFRVARRARVSAVATLKSISCVIKGFYHGFNSAIHQRDFELETSALSITDKVSKAEQGIAYFYLHPSIQAVQTTKDGDLIDLGDGITMQIIGTNDIKLEPTFWYSEFGKSESTLRIVARFNNELKTRVLR